MKKIYSFLALVCLLTSAKATTHIVTVSSFQFTPSNLNVVVGDVIRWEWASGFHSTESLTIPAGAAPWASTVETTGFSYEYTVTRPGVYQYQCAPHAGFMMGMFTASGVVPVKMTGFTVQSRNKKAFLSWNTETESNSSYFAIRRSYDGEMFTEIGRVPAAGYSNQMLSYSFLDTDVKRNCRYVYYEIAITDNDASVQLSPIRLLKNNDAVNKIITSISPNPVTAAGHLIIQFNADEKLMLKARLTDIAGKTMLETQMAAMPGVNNGHIHIGDIPSGNYTIQFMLHQKIETYRIVKQ